MEIREFAEMIFQGTTVEEKCFRPEGGIRALTDHNPGPSVMWREPGRSDHLIITPNNRNRRLPRPSAMHDKNMRIRCLHTFANHELMALEMMAWALLAFPDAPRPFRIGLLRVLEDEQRHFELYSQQIEEMGTKFGDLPLNDHFFRLAPMISSPLKWVCAMHLTLEQANLDHAPFYRDIFQGVGDEGAAALMHQIFEDEIMHVQFGAHWLKRYKPQEQSCFDAFVENLAHNNPVHRARSSQFFNADGRRAAGLDEDFIESIEKCVYGKDPRYTDSKPSTHS